MAQLLSLKRRTKTHPVVFFTIFIYMLMGNRCWIGFGLMGIAPYLVFFLMAVYGLTGLVKYQWDKKHYVVFTLLVFLSSFYTIHAWTLNINGIVGLFFPALTILFVISLPDEDKDAFLHYCVKWFGIIMLISIAVYLVNNFVSLPSLGRLNAYYGTNRRDDIVFNNFIFYIDRLGWEGFMRFNGPFIEPGDVGCISAFLLYAAQFNFKKYKYLWVVLFSIILSFSLAGYMLALLGYVFCLFAHRRIKMGVLLFSASFMMLFYWFGTYYNGGDNIVNELIFSRLQSSDDDRYVMGNNRTTLLLLDYYNGMFNDLKVFLFGYDANTVAFLEDERRASAGMIARVVSIGFVGVFSILLPFIYFSINAKDKRYGWGFFALLFAYLLQRSEAFLIAIVLTYVYGIVVNDYYKNTK